MWKIKFGQGRNKIVKLNIKNLEKVDFDNLPRHIAIIMDGNGRWAKKRGMPRVFGHRAGAKITKAVVRAASDIGIKVLTVYAFSTENWKRPQEEVNMLMNLFSEYLDNEVEEMHQNNVQIRFLGNTEELAEGLQQRIEKTKSLTKNNTGLILNLAINYGSRSEIVRAVQIIAGKVQNGELEKEKISAETIAEHLYTANLPDPDLLIRPSGDFRISNYLLWQLAYAEFWFTETNWPDFTPECLVEAILAYQKRERRFGGLK